MNVRTNSSVNVNRSNGLSRTLLFRSLEREIISLAPKKEQIYGD